MDILLYENHQNVCLWWPLLNRKCILGPCFLTTETRVQTFWTNPCQWVTRLDCLSLLATTQRDLQSRQVASYVLVGVESLPLTKVVGTQQRGGGPMDWKGCKYVIGICITLSSNVCLFMWAPRIKVWMPWFYSQGSHEWFENSIRYGEEGLNWLHWLCRFVCVNIPSYASYDYLMGL